MTKSELRQKLLFACMQNPALADGTPLSGTEPWPEAPRKAIYTALDTAYFIISEHGEDFDIDPNSE